MPAQQALRRTPALWASSYEGGGASVTATFYSLSGAINHIYVNKTSFFPQREVLGSLCAVDNCPSKSRSFSLNDDIQADM